NFNAPAPPPAKAESKPKEEEISYETVSSSTNNSSHNFNTKSASNGNRFYSPLVLNIAASEGLSMTELEKVPGTGNEGRVTKKDILKKENVQRSFIIHCSLKQL